MADNPTIPAQSGYPAVPLDMGYPAVPLGNPAVPLGNPAVPLGNPRVPLPGSLAKSASSASKRIYLPQPQPGNPVFKNPKPLSWVSYSGQDIRAYIQIYGQLVWLANLYTLSYSSFRDIIPVRGMGQAAALAHARGHRTVAGSMVFTQFNKEAFFDWLSFMGHDRNASGWYPVWVDQIPPFNLVVLCQGEVRRDVYSQEWKDLISTHVVEEGSPQSRLIIYQVSLAGGGSTMSVDDMITEGVYNYHALGIAPLMDVSDGALAGSPMLNGEDAATLLKNYKGAAQTAATSKATPSVPTIKPTSFSGASSALSDMFPDPQTMINNAAKAAPAKGSLPEVPDESPTVYNPGNLASGSQLQEIKDEIKDEQGDGDIIRLDNSLLNGSFDPPGVDASKIAPGSAQAKQVEQAAQTAPSSQLSDNRTPLELLVPRLGKNPLSVVATPAGNPSDTARSMAWIDSKYGQQVTTGGGLQVQPPSVTTLGQVTNGAGAPYDVHVVQK